MNALSFLAAVFAASVRIVDGAIVNVEDFSQDLEVQIVVEHVDEDSFDEEKNPLKFQIGGGKIAPKPKKRARSENDSPGHSGFKFKKVKKSCEEFSDLFLREIAKPFKEG